MIDTALRFLEMTMRHLIVRDRKSGRPVAIPISSIPEEIRPENWFENAYWRYRSDGEDLEPMIQALYDGSPLSEESIRKLSQYIFDYACHISVMGYLFGGVQEYNIECIRKLREIKKEAKSKEDVKTMIRLGMEYALDPF